MSYICRDKGRHDAQKRTILFLLNTNLISTPIENTIIFIPHWTWYKTGSAIVLKTLVLYSIKHFFFRLFDWKMKNTVMWIFYSLYMYKYNIITTHNIYCIHECCKLLYCNWFSRGQRLQFALRGIYLYSPTAYKRNRKFCGFDISEETTKQYNMMNAQCIILFVIILNNSNEDVL